MWNRIATTTLVLFCAALILADRAAAQDPQWNRRARAIAVVPNAAGAHDLALSWDAQVNEPTSVPLNLSMDVEVLVNGTVIGVVTVPVSIDPGTQTCTDGPSCQGSCGSGHVDGVFESLLCIEDGPNDCKCSLPQLALPLPTPEPLSPGDEVMVILRPAPGALPEPDTSDDAILIVFDGGPIFWDHRIESIDLTAVAPGVFDITANAALFFDGVDRYVDPTSGLSMSVELELLVGGVPVATHLEIIEVMPFGGNCFFGDCGGSCAQIGTIPLGCTTFGPNWCSCGFFFSPSFPSTPLEPGDEVVVILRPVPGALPELPGFEEDDELSVLCCPTQSVGSSNVVSATGTFLEQNTPNPFNPATSIGFVLGQRGRVTLDVYDHAGRSVRHLISGDVLEAGAQSIAWDGSNELGGRSPSGIYFYRLTAPGFSETRKMILLQ